MTTKMILSSLKIYLFSRVALKQREIDRETVCVSNTVSSWKWAVYRKHPNVQTWRMLETTNSWHLQARTHTQANHNMWWHDVGSGETAKTIQMKWLQHTRPYKFVTNKQPNYYQIRHPPKLWPLTVFHISSKSYSLNISALFFVLWPFPCLHVFFLRFVC